MAFAPDPDVEVPRRAATAFDRPSPIHARAAAKPLASLSAVLPARDEEGNIDAAVREVWREVERFAAVAEIIVVDDGSTDRTAARVEDLVAEIPALRLVRHPVSRGYGAALRSGFAAARGEWLFFTDADRQFDLAELGRLVGLASEHDVVAGFRANRGDPLHRRVMASAWNRLIATALGVRMRDVNCAFKLLRADLVRRLELTSDGPAFGAELALALEREGVRIAQVPVAHRPRAWGRQSGGSPAVVLRGLIELRRLRLG